VSWHKVHQQWQGNVRHNGKLYYVGRFDTIAEAEAAVKRKRLELFTHNDIDRDIPIDRPFPHTLMSAQPTN